MSSVVGSVGGGRPLSLEDLAIDVEGEADRICRAVVDHAGRSMRRGAVVALAGDVGSAVTAALCVRAIGQDRVLALLLPERESAEDMLRLARLAAGSLGVETLLEDVTPALEAVGCYRRRDDAVRLVCPAYGEGWRSKLVLPSVLESDGIRLCSVLVQPPEGPPEQHRLTPDSYLALLAALSLKPRVRKMLEHHHADRLNFVTTGTSNRLEHDQGLFVRLGDGEGDIKPLAHLYQTQVQALAAYLGIPGPVRNRPPSTDPLAPPRSGGELCFALPPAQMDLCLFAHNRALPAAAAAAAAGLSPEQVERVFRDLDQRRRETRRQHLASRLVEPVAEIRSLT
ncbi:NAD(+) synthase [Nocardioides panaciterrulae]|uniref:NH(3)-dependent NAD(+) synthetase n=1 Tax=Nocardioides panaciterrulae TaxID=661492 RepID=A0A7Y9JBJ0_9ACTN|nr:NAD(+) synthase [Nocardioides panaciterrulae]NYD42847.1 NAD+ synthase [Nocardioides panaciterrulae]